MLVTNYHCCIKLDKLLELTLKGMVGFLVNDRGYQLTESEIYQLVKDEKAKGHIYFSGCGHRDSEGRCLGHKIEANSQSEANPPVI